MSKDSTTKSHKKGNRGLKSLVPASQKGWAVFAACIAVGVAPLVYVTGFYKGDTYCSDLISQGVQVDCTPEVATDMYLLSAGLWLLASLMVLYTGLTNKEKLQSSMPKGSRKKHAEESTS